MVRFYRVIQIKLNELVSENVYMITDLPTKHIFSAISVTNILKSFYLQDGGKNQLA